MTNATVAADQPITDSSANNASEPRHHGLLMRALVYGTSLPPARRRRLYLLVMTGTLLLVWGPITLMIMLKPVSYTSEWTLILPGKGNGQTVNIDSIGQATSNNASPFSNSSIDPIVNYKAIATSLPVLAEAANKVSISSTDFGTPRIKLVDQTSMIHFQVKGSSAQLAQQKSLALYEALQQQLEDLRNDEARRITEASLSTITDFDAKLQRAQQQKLDYQAQTGIISVEQFNQLISRLEQNQNQAEQLKAKREQLQSQISSMLDNLTLDQQMLRHAVTLRNDALFQQQLAQHANIHIQISSVDATLGKNNPHLRQLQATHDSIQSKIIERGRRITGLKKISIAELIDLGSNALENELLQQLIILQAEYTGIEQQLTAVQQWNTDLATRIDTTASNAIKLEDLSRKQQVATAVFSTALAKQDIGKIDRFASYPLIQMLAQPTLPAAPDNLHTKLALTGGAAATLIILWGLLLLWLRKPLLQQILKSA
ncbi:hypothetical protein Q4488_10320 [Amphritea sp. 1_MG-2023]|uniref:hypothetical protein n=1 Tax=Amphritea sp. 1_MG-2023 TaxID=3062670 RepID=UPI0026E1BF5F|nr:hypothetical protein [Amphritea sp. 1_MG-2023]MDO6563776.1 hypothetical protein [Amphritea sp. 1_MG-2023]